MRDAGRTTRPCCLLSVWLGTDKPPRYIFLPALPLARPFA